ncbi:unnamed protein product [Staurois parvus]|uniref:Uncharacterized protein n=1 Tax=Staurois parvus TaxID=386267 RepID=A0ABN9EHW2_9NEOB|nr:unnamed protein product [Staurois parvus]
MDSPLVVGLTCPVGCSTRAGQRVLSAARSSLLQSSHHLRQIAGGVFREWPGLQSVPWCIVSLGACILILPA